MVSQVQPREETDKRLRAKQFIILTVLGMGGTTRQPSHVGKPWGGQEAGDRSEGKDRVTAFISNSKRKARQGKVNSVRLAHLNIFSGLWAIEVVPGCLAPGPGMIKAKEYCLLACTATSTQRFSFGNIEQCKTYFINAD